MFGAPVIRAFFDEPTNTVSYLVADPQTRRAAVIDPVLDYDPKSGEVDTRSVTAILEAAAEAGYRVEWALETHAHADHLSRLSLREGEDRRQDRHRRAHQGRAADFPAGLQCDRSQSRRPRFRPSVRRRRAVQDRRPRCRGSAHARATRRPASATGSRTPSSSATRCSCPTTARRAPTFPAATRTSSIARSSGC